MSPFFYIFLALVGVLLILFAWAVRKPARPIPAPSSLSLENLLETWDRKHATYFPQIQQAFAKTDDEFLRQASKAVLQRVRRERNRVGLAYLKSLRTDFQNLLHTASMVALLSPEVTAVQEWERVRLTVKFFWNYEITRMKLLAGFAPLPQLSGLANVVSGLSVRLEGAVKEIAERAAMASKLGSSPEGRGVGLT